MDRPSSSEIHAGGARTRGALLLVVLSVLSSPMLLASPLFAAGAAQLVFGATDAATARLFGFRHPSAAVRIGARALGAAAWGGAMSAVAGGRGAQPSPTRPLLLAFALVLGVVVGSIGTIGARTSEMPRSPAIDETRPAFGGSAIESPLVGASDAATAAWIVLLSLIAHDATPLTRVLLSGGVLVALLLRALGVATAVAAAAREPSSPRLAAIGFVAWIAVAAFACAVVPTPTTWSGLGAAVVLTAAAVLVELRHKRAIVVFLRGSLAFSAAAMVAVATLLAT